MQGIGNGVLVGVEPHHPLKSKQNGLIKNESP